MTGEELLKNMDLIDHKLVKDADEYTPPKRKTWLKWGVLAAAAALLAIMFLWKPEHETVTNIGGIPRKYKSIPIAQSETDPVYPWEYLTEIEKYTGMNLNGISYRTRARTLDPAFLGECIGSCSFLGYDIYTDQHFPMEKMAYEIKGISPSKLVAVNLEGAFCVFIKETYSPPIDFADFWDSISLSDQVVLAEYTHFGGENADNQQTWYSLKQDDVLWEMLADCRQTPCLELERFYDASIETISFSVTSEPLGVYKHGFQISSDGYISTNLMEWGYVFQIGESAAREIIDYVKDNSEPATAQPYYHYLYGTFVGTEDGYLLIDDSVLCVNEKDGMIFRIPADDIRISRTVELGYVSTGDVVLVNYLGKIDPDSGNTVSEPVSIQRGILWDDKILIEE